MCAGSGLVLVDVCASVVTLVEGMRWKRRSGRKMRMRSSEKRKRRDRWRTRVRSVTWRVKKGNGNAMIRWRSQCGEGEAGGGQR